MQYVCENLYCYVPAPIRLFISQEGFTQIIQKIYDKLRKSARDVLSDGKFDGKEGK